MTSEKDNKPDVSTCPLGGFRPVSRQRYKRGVVRPRLTLVPRSGLGSRQTDTLSLGVPGEKDWYNRQDLNLGRLVERGPFISAPYKMSVGRISMVQVVTGPDNWGFVDSSSVPLFSIPKPHVALSQV